MRLDKYLKVSRIIKRRTLAAEACAAGKVSVNGTVVKASYTVKVGDVIALTFGSKVNQVEVTAIKESTKKEDAALMYKTI